ncbi:MAG: class I SAM-dependent methyltransferase [Planctomycetes bacterium]|nr:class I SAM-dependent methyltransferase [Planctomycetota bacterium]
MNRSETRRRAGRLTQALQFTKSLAKRSVVTAVGPGRLAELAVEFLRAGEATYSKETLALLLSDITARSGTARQAELCQTVLEHWRDGAAFAPYALRTFRILEAGLSKLGLEFGPSLDVCELGPGDSLCLAALIAETGSSYVGIDPWPPVLDRALYDLAIRYFREQAEIDVSSILDNSSDPIRHAESIRRLASGRSVPSASVDVLFSIAVLEHVRDPQAALAESWRILRPGGVAVHQIDYEDHRGRGPAGWDFLRFSTSEWDRLHEGDSARDYTNRVRHSKWLGLVQEVGFQVEEVSVANTTPPSHLRVHSDLLPLEEGDLGIQGSHIVLRKP